MLLRTPLHARKTQLFYFQWIPHSLHKTTRGWGGGMFGRSQLAEITKDPPLQARRARYLRPRLDFMMISGQRAKIEVVRAPRGVNSPRTTHHSGRTASTTSRRILLTAFS